MILVISLVSKRTVHSKHEIQGEFDFKGTIYKDADRGWCIGLELSNNQDVNNR